MLSALSTTQLPDTALHSNRNPWASLKDINTERKETLLHTMGVQEFNSLSHLPGCPGSVAALEEEQSSAAAKHQKIWSCQGSFPFLFYGGMHSCAVRKQDIHPATFMEECRRLSDKHCNIQILATTTQACLGNTALIVIFKKKS